MTLAHAIAIVERFGYQERKKRARHVADFIRSHKRFAMPLVSKLSNALLLDEGYRYAIAKSIVLRLGFHFIFIRRSDLEWALECEKPETWWFLGTARGRQFVDGTCSVLIYA